MGVIISLIPSWRADREWVESLKEALVETDIAECRGSSVEAFVLVEPEIETVTFYTEASPCIVVTATEEDGEFWQMSLRAGAKSVVALSKDAATTAAAIGEMLRTLQKEVLEV